MSVEERQSAKAPKAEKNVTVTIDRLRIPLTSTQMAIADGARAVHETSGLDLREFPSHEQLTRVERGLIALYVAEVDAKVVGYSSVFSMTEERMVHVKWLVVSPRMRRRGVATELLLRLAQDSLDSDIQFLVLEPLANTDIDTRALWTAYGFTEAEALGYPGALAAPPMTVLVAIQGPNGESAI